MLAVAVHRQRPFKIVVERPSPAGLQSFSFAEVDFVPVGPWNTDGLIVVTPLLSEARAAYIQQLSATGHPVVFIASGGSGPTVTVDNAGGVHQVVRHLVEHGHRRIAFIAGRPDDLEGDSGIRLRAYQAAVHDYRLVVDQRFIAYGYHGIDGGQRAMRHILNSGVAFTAVLAIGWRKCS